MLTLGFDTCTEMCTLALGDSGGVLAAIDVLAPRAHLQKLLPLAEQLLASCARTQEDIEAVAVGTGPGSLTGVRIGVTTARTLSQGLDVPCIGLPTLDVIAHAFSGTGATVCVVLDARRKEVYPALYDCGGAVPRRLTEFHAVNPGALADELAGRDEPRIVLCGDALVAYGEVFAERLGSRAHITPREHWYPRASCLVDLADALPQAQRGDYREVLPIYTRLSDAEEAERSRR